MEIPLLDLKAQYRSIKSEIDQVLSKVVESQYFILSGEVASLEKEVSDYCDVPSAAGVASGTDALILALRALGIGKGDAVITTPFTFFATAEAVSILGARPFFVDIDPGTYNIDPDKVEELLQNMDPGTRRTVKAIIPVHLYGQCADMARIMDIAKKYDLKVIEDSAQAIGATYKGKKAASFGDAGCLSFFPSKNLGGFGDGGMIVSPDASVIEEVKMLRVHGSKEMYIHEEIGYNSRLDSLQAAILRIKLKKLDAWLDARRSIAEKYNEAFAEMGIITPMVAEENTHTYHQYTIAVQDRDELLEHLDKNGIAARVYYPVPLHLQPCYKCLEYSIGSFPVSEEKAEKVLSLPVYSELTGEQIEYIIRTVKDFYNK
ncbi:MAG: DegT/DnrJ/EryC1/StrS family aminotransferase [Candidatus Omnitrophica bacterium]|nr:DegT/DnrJ/EryC1/StrS family aminotransferase [Candidatus Omnitrophota bacterium]